MIKETVLAFSNSGNRSLLCIKAMILDVIFYEIIFPLKGSLTSDPDILFAKPTATSHPAPTIPSQQINVELPTDPPKDPPLHPPTVSVDTKNIIKTGRTTSKPAHLKFLYAIIPLISLDKYLKYDKLHKSFQNAILKASIELETTSYSQASKLSQWLKAMDNEFFALKQNNAWSIVSLPLDAMLLETNGYIRSNTIQKVK
uniref:Uncharacterized protein n=1 Tax=Cannabis sativa TaxID=3483 RepID=A0A803PC46_CANSA